MNPSRLTMKVLEHQKTGSGYGELMKEIVQEVVENRESYGFCNKDEACDLLTQYYPRISSLVRRFSGENRCFEPFLFSSLRYFRKSIECRKREDALREREMQFRETPALERSEYEEESESDSVETALPMEGLIHALSLNPENGASLSSARKRLLFLGMKCAFSLTEKHVAALARLAELPENFLNERISFLRTMAEPRFSRLEYLTGLRDRLYAALCIRERKLHEELDEFKRLRHGSAVERLRDRLSNCRKRLQAVRVEPTNAEIALAFGVPKGTVDSGIYCFKHFNARLPS